MNWLRERLKRLLLGDVAVVVVLALLTVYGLRQNSSPPLAPPTTFPPASSPIKSMYVAVARQKSALDSVLIIDALISNDGPYAVKDPELTCLVRGQSGTPVSVVSRVVYQRILAGDSVHLDNLNLGFINPQGQTPDCQITHVTGDPSPNDPLPPTPVKDDPATLALKNKQYQAELDAELRANLEKLDAQEQRNKQTAAKDSPVGSKSSVTGKQEAPKQAGSKCFEVPPNYVNDIRLGKAVPALDTSLPPCHPASPEMQRMQAETDAAREESRAKQRAADDEFLAQMKAKFQAEEAQASRP